MFSPILCAGLLFGSAIKHSTSLARDYGTNLLGAMVGGVAEYLSLVTGFRFLLFIVAVFYIARGADESGRAAAQLTSYRPTRIRYSNSIERLGRFGGGSTWDWEFIWSGWLDSDWTWPAAGIK